MRDKPKILLVPNVAWWIIGEMSKRIIERFSDRYDFYSVPETVLARRPDLLRSLVKGVDAIHCLNESSVSLLSGFDPQYLPPIATWIHHVASWTGDHQLAMELSSAITVCTPEWKQYVAERTRRNMRIIVIGHGVDGQFFVKRDVNRKRFGVPGSSFVVGLVGSKSSDRDCNRKGVDIFLDVAHRVSARIGQLHIVLGGPGWDRELAELRAAKISASATGYLAKSELPFLYSALDVYLLTSRVEGGPCTVFEAMSCQTPVVATRVGAVPELIENGVNGYLAAVDDVEALTAAVLKLSQTEGHRKTIGGNARRTILARGWDEMLSPLGDLYEELIAIRRSQITPRCCPIWMTDPAEVTHASAAADVLAEVVSRVRNRHLGVLVGLRRIREMLEGRPLSDIASGVRVLHGTSFKAEADR